MTALTNAQVTGKSPSAGRQLIGLRPAAVPAWRALIAALVELDRRGIRTPCSQNPAAFVGADFDRRHAAAKECGACPVRRLCGGFADANRERAHVWGGRDRTWGAKRAASDRLKRQRPVKAL